ncbi:Hypothetical protein SMAX5B_001747 [Scophthalmus maximus]|uniref:Uncharacterized protein n=1 Tax=Scophthalmus maximus TaxID=52904 RepID=A0A2U9CVG6_SCOMX|nr:Hypothetical protein SMAX5B_001747 [Scophthalmus maximus]
MIQIRNRSRRVGENEYDPGETDVIMGPACVFLKEKSLWITQKGTLAIPKKVMAFFTVNSADTETEGDLGGDSHAASSITIHRHDSCNRLPQRGEDVTYFSTLVRTLRKRRIVRDKYL